MKNKLQKYVILDGQVRSGGELLQRGAEVEFDPEEMKAIDPHGTEFCTPEQWKLINQKDGIEEALTGLAEGEASKPKRKSKLNIEELGTP